MWEAIETYPNVSKYRTVGALAVLFKILRDDGGNGHGDADKAVVVDADPVNVEPGQAALGGAPRAALAAAASGEPVEGHDPGLDGAHLAEKVLLGVQVGGDVVAEEGKEGGNGKGLVAVGYDLKVDGLAVPLDLKKRRDGVDGDHEENADNVALLAGFRVVEGVHPCEVQAEEDGNEGAGGANDAGELVKGEVADDFDFGAGLDPQVLQRVVARQIHGGGCGASLPGGGCVWCVAVLSRTASMAVDEVGVGSGAGA